MRFTTWLSENYSNYQDTCEVCGLPDEDKVYMVNDEIYLWRAESPYFCNQKFRHKRAIASVA